MFFQSLFHLFQIFQRYRFPLSVTMVHFVVVFLLATLFRCLLEFYYKKKRVVLEWGVYLKQVFPTGKFF